MKDNQLKKWEDTEKKLRLLVSLLPTIISDSDLQQINEFIDANEYGVALETICSSIIDSQQKPSEEIRKLIEILGRQMSMDAKLWEKLS